MNTLTQNKVIDLAEDFPDSIINPFIVVQCSNVAQISGKTIKGNGTLKLVEVVISDLTALDNISCTIEFFNCTFETNCEFKGNYRISGVTTLNNNVIIEMNTSQAEGKVMQGNGNAILSGRIQNMNKFRNIKCEKSFNNITFG